ncbi:MAG: AAA family ATPase [Blastocatellia bacterium]|nr:AAA family ATPase [Blastocatellia bacterium]
MAFMIPESISNISTVTPGEERLFRLLKAKLPDTICVWYDVPIRGRYADFVIFDPALGVLILEVKDWAAATIHAVTPTRVLLATPNGEKAVVHPLQQARRYAHGLVAALETDSVLVHPDGEYQGRLVIPFGYGVVWTNLKKAEFGPTFGGFLEPAHMIFRDSLTPSMEPETLRELLAGLFHQRFAFRLSPTQIDRLRWHVFPEIRLDRRPFAKVQPVPPASFQQPTLPGTELDDATVLAVMDYEQERLAKSLGDGHRLVRGVAGSGKTWTLICRARLLAQLHPQWRILVVCYNATLVAFLASVLGESKTSRIEVKTFHSLLQRSAVSAGVPVLRERFTDQAVTELAEDLTRRRADGRWQSPGYDAILIDEAHDFPSEWLRLVVALLNPATDSLFIVYDGAQNIYRRGFSFAKVGIKVRGRTKLLRTNYRNTREIAEFAADFLGEGVNFAPDEPLRDDEGQLLEIVRPATTARSGPPPLLVACASFREECAETAARVKQWIERDGILPADILVLYVKKGAVAGDAKYVRALLSAFAEAGIPCEWIARDSRSKQSFRMDSPTVKVSTIHSAKGLDFDAVALVGVSLLPSPEGDAALERKLVYIGLTRARRRLLITWCKPSQFVRELLKGLPDNRLED